MTPKVWLVRGHRWASAALASAVMVAWLWQGGSRVGIFIGAALMAGALLWLRRHAEDRPATIALAIFCILAFITLLEYGLTVGTRGRRIFSMGGASFPWFVEVIALSLVGIAGATFLGLAGRGLSRAISAVAGVAYVFFSLVAQAPGIDQTKASVASAAAFFATVTLAILALRLGSDMRSDRQASSREVDLSP